MVGSIVRPVEIARADQLSEADAVRSRLDAAGIAARIEVDSRDGPSQLVVVVDAADEANARATATKKLAPPPDARPNCRFGWELLAVLAVGVIPNLLGSITSALHPGDPLPFWLDSLNLTVLCGCTIVATLHISRPGMADRERLGLTWPSLGDIVLAPFILVVSLFALRLSSLIPYPAGPTGQSLFALPAGAVEWSVAAGRYVVSAYAEELVYRVYLITRLTDLLGSHFQAIAIAAVLFASSHVYQGPLGTTNALFMGLAYGAIYSVNRRIWPLVFGHASYNTLLDYLHSA